MSSPRAHTTSRPAAGARRHVALPFTAVVNDRGTERVRVGHPWIYVGDILGWEPEPPPDSWTEPVGLRDRRSRELGVGDFSPHSQIRVRVLSRDPAAAQDAVWFRQRLEAAIDYRRRVVSGSDAYRVVAAEADGLPGLIVDKYGDGVAFQTLTWAMASRQPLIVDLLSELLEPSVLVERNESAVRRREGLELCRRMLHGTSPEIEVDINGLRFHVDLLAGQKTGSFLDQRENWMAAARHAGLAGAQHGLDVFTYQGGFALHLARAGVKMEAVDSSRPALEAGDRNALSNGLSAIDWIEANAFDLLHDYDQAGREFDLVVLDPPAFAKSRSALGAAAGAYKEINLRALKLLRPGGVLVSCSCSHHLSENHLLELLAAAAADAHRPLTILERRGAALDHPVLLSAPETSYLKCIIAAAR